MTDTVKNIGRYATAVVAGAGVMWTVSQTLLSHGSDWGTLNAKQQAEHDERVAQVAKLETGTKDADEKLQKQINDLVKSVNDLALVAHDAQQNYKFIDIRLNDIKSDLGELKKMVLENRVMGGSRSFNQSEAPKGDGNSTN